MSDDIFDLPRQLGSDVALGTCGCGRQVALQVTAYGSEVASCDKSCEPADEAPASDETPAPAEVPDEAPASVEGSEGEGS